MRAVELLPRLQFMYLYTQLLKYKNLICKILFQAKNKEGACFAYSLLGDIFCNGPPFLNGRSTHFFIKTAGLFYFFRLLTYIVFFKKKIKKKKYKQRPPLKKKNGRDTHHVFICIWPTFHHLVFVVNGTGGVCVYLSLTRV